MNVDLSRVSPTLRMKIIDGIRQIAGKEAIRTAEDLKAWDLAGATAEKSDARKDMDGWLVAARELASLKEIKQ